MIGLDKAALWVGWLMLAAAAAWAQPVAPSATPSATPSVTSSVTPSATPPAMPAVLPPAAASSGAAATPTVVEPAASQALPGLPVALPSCTGLTDQAMAVDLATANAQAQRTAATDLARLLDRSSELWQQAEAVCTGRAKDRARRNQADSQKARSSMGEILNSGERCQASQQDANTLEELARRLLGDRRWLDAASVFRHAETQWELAAERCSNAPQQLALQRRELAETDAHNAEHCAMRFQPAMDQSQRLRSGGAAMAPAERQLQLQIAETLWREASEHCKGAALDLARGQAQTAARDRGTTWVSTPALPVATRAARAQTAQAEAPANEASRVPAGSSASSEVDGAAADASAKEAAPAPTLARESAAALTSKVNPQPAPIDVILGTDTRLIGIFALDPGGTTYSGQGKILWANGEVYDGAIAQGKRHGIGEFVWTSGQRYRGEWADDRPQGQGQMRFANGNVYEGLVDDGQPQGQGRMIYASGDVYKGMLRSGEPHGTGAYLWISGQRFEGNWIYGKAHGSGVMSFANGNHYEGEVAQGVPHGTGRLRFANGDVYQGGVVQGLPDGEGSFSWKNGDRYAGAWKAGAKHGRGVMRWDSGDEWKGVFAGDQPTEQGELTRAKTP